MMVYSLTHLEKFYEGRKVLNIRRLEIEQNRIYALLGPNGAGKTTLLNILAFLEPPTSGQVCYNSKPVRFVESTLLPLRREVIMVDQHPILFTTTVFKNLEFGLKIRNVSKKNRIRLIKEALELVGMRDFISARANRLSGGETQRVALARALVLSPKVFLCDEPMSGVDIENQIIINRILTKINEKKGTTIIFTSHDRTQASRIAHQTLVLDRGSLVTGGFENVFTVNVNCQRDGENRCTLHSGVSLIMASHGTDNTKKNIRIVIDPGKIRLHCNTGKKSLKNVLQGKVTQLVEEDKKIRVVIDAKVALTMMMHMQTYRQNRLLVGDTITIFIPPEAVRIIE